MVQANSSFNINNKNYDYDEVNAHCLGIGTATKNNSEYITTFKASLCRVNENVIRNVIVIVIFKDNDININYDVSKKLFFAPVGYISYAKYNSNTNIWKLGEQL